MKPYSNSKWNRLSPAQRAIVDRWLFDDQLGYAEIVARARREFGIEASLMSLSRYYQRRCRERHAAPSPAVDSQRKAFSEFLLGLLEPKPQPAVPTHKSSAP